jgi:hypothetical protein
MPYPFTVQDLLVGINASTVAPNGGVWNKLSQRQDVITYGPQWIADAVLELSRDYRFENLETTGPTVQMTAGTYQYPLSFFQNPGDTYPNLIPSFFMFYDIPLQPVTGYNPGIGLTWKTIDSMELMFSTQGTPAYWTRYQQQIYVAPSPINNYYGYMRYQKQHPFSQPAALTDVIMLPDEWREIVEYSAALRGAGDLRMLDYAEAYHKILFGDPASPAQVGLISKRISQIQADSVENQGMRQIRPMNGRRY